MYLMKKHSKIMILTVVLLCLGMISPALASETSIRGWDGNSYQYVYFGSLPGSSMPQSILWRVLAVGDGSALLLSELVLDSQPFDDDSTDWNESDIKEWLNDSFLKSAFQNRNAFDAIVHDYDLGRVFLLSKGDYLNEGFGFSSDPAYADSARVASGDATAIQNGLWTSKGSALCSHYTRTADGKSTLFQISTNGSFGSAKFDRDNVGIRPAIRVYLSWLTISGGKGTMASPFTFSN